MQRPWLITIGIAFLLNPIVACNNANPPTAAVPTPSATVAPFDEPGRVYLADRQLSIVPPEGFVALSAAEITQQYPTSNPPNYVFANADHTASIAITFTPQALSLKQLPEGHLEQLPKECLIMRLGEKTKHYICG